MPYFGHLWDSMRLYLDNSEEMHLAIQVIDRQLMDHKAASYHLFECEGSAGAVWKTSRFQITLLPKDRRPSLIKLRDRKTQTEITHEIVPGDDVKLPHSMLKAIECPDSLYVKTVGGSSPVAISSRWI